MSELNLLTELLLVGQVRALHISPPPTQNHQVGTKYTQHTLNDTSLEYFTKTQRPINIAMLKYDLGPGFLCVC